MTRQHKRRHEASGVEMYVHTMSAITNTFRPFSFAEFIDTAGPEKATVFTMRLIAS